MAKVADRIRHLISNVYYLDDEMFTLYLVDAEKATLIDAAILAKLREVEHFLEKTAGSRRLEQVVLTHSHYDHCGTLTELQKKHGCKVFCASYCAEIMKNPKAISLIDHLNQEYKKLLGVKNDLHFERPDLISPLNESDKIPLSDRQYLVSYSTPGHTRCSFSFMLYPEMVLFTGDAAGVMEKDGTVRPLFLSSYKYYIDSLQKLETLPAEYLALPHNKPLRGREAIKDFFERSIDTTIALKERILRELQRGGKIEKIAEELFREFYAQSTLSGPKEAFMINLQAMVKAVSNEFLA